MKPRKNFRSRPKKSGAKKRQKTLSQARRLKASGVSDEELKSLSAKEIRLKIKEVAKKPRKKQPKKKAVKKAVKKAAPKKVVKKAAPKKAAPKKEAPKKAAAKPMKKAE